MKALFGNRRKHNRIKYFLFPLPLFLFFVPMLLRVKAAADFSDYETVRHPLIQVTDVQDEYEALFRLGFLYTGEWERASFLREQKVSSWQREVEGNGNAREKTVSGYGWFMELLARERADEKARASVVQIRIGSYYGSGVLWNIRDGKLVIASNAHLLKEGQEGQVTFRTGVSVEGKVIGISDTKDVGFMEVELASLEREDWLFMRFAESEKETAKELEVGDRIFVIGSASGTGEDYYEGTVGDTGVYFPEFQSKMLYGYCKAVPGMSGGGTFDEKGNFLGMLTAGTGQGEIASLPLEIMIEEYDKLWETP